MALFGKTITTQGWADPEPATTRAPSRQRETQASVYLRPEALKQLGITAIREESSVQALLVEAINDLFAKRGLNRIA